MKGQQCWVWQRKMPGQGWGGGLAVWLETVRRAAWGKRLATKAQQQPKASPSHLGRVHADATAAAAAAAAALALLRRRAPPTALLHQSMPPRTAKRATSKPSSTTPPLVKPQSPRAAPSSNLKAPELPPRQTSKPQSCPLAKASDTHFCCLQAWWGASALAAMAAQGGASVKTGTRPPRPRPLRAA